MNVPALTEYMGIYDLDFRYFFHISNFVLNRIAFMMSASAAIR